MTGSASLCVKVDVVSIEEDISEIQPGIQGVRTYTGFPGGEQIGRGGQSGNRRGRLVNLPVKTNFPRR